MGSRTSQDRLTRPDHLIFHFPARSSPARRSVTVGVTKQKLRPLSRAELSRTAQLPSFCRVTFPLLVKMSTALSCGEHSASMPRQVLGESLALDPKCPAEAPRLSRVFSSSTLIIFIETKSGYLPPPCTCLANSLAERPGSLTASCPFCASSLAACPASPAISFPL